MSNVEDSILYRVDYINSYVEGYIGYLVGTYIDGVLISSKTRRLSKDVDEFTDSLSKSTSI